MLQKTDWNSIQAAGMKYLRTLKGCTGTDQLRNQTYEMSWVSSLYMNTLQNTEATGCISLFGADE
jgi:hypothetical protein